MTTDEGAASDVPTEVATKLTNALTRMMIAIRGRPAPLGLDLVLDREEADAAHAALHGAIQEAVVMILDEMRKPAAEVK